MQLSAPSLPLDPNAQLSSDSTGFPAFGNKADARGSAPADFGAMLTAKSRDETSAKPSANPNGLHPGRGHKRGSRHTSGDTDSEEISSTAGLIEPQAAVVIPPKAVEAGRELVFLSVEPIAGTTGSDNPGESMVLAAPSSDGKGGTGDRRPVHGAIRGTAQASLRAYGVANERSVSRNGVRSPAAPGPGTESSVEPRSLPAGTTSTFGAPFSEQAAASDAALRVQPQQIEPPGRAAPLPIAKGADSDVLLGGSRSATQPSSSGDNAGALPQVRGAGRADVDASQFPLAPTPEGLDAGEVSVAPSSTAMPEISASDMQGAEVSMPERNSPVASDIIGATADELMDAQGQYAFANAVSSAEKIAAQVIRGSRSADDKPKLSEKSSVTANSENVAGSKEIVGINAAKPEVLMSATASIKSPASVVAEPASLNATPLSFDALIKEDSAESGHQVSIAHRAVESVLIAADQLATGEQRSVRLQFTVGGEELAVRVELRGDKVHTTFRTDSSELRSALAHEWQSVSAVQSGVRTQRLADPVFASNSSTNGQGFSSDSGATHQRDSAPRHPHGTPDEIFGARRAFSTTTIAPAAATPAPVSVPAPGMNPLRLHTFA